MDTTNEFVVTIFPLLKPLLGLGLFLPFTAYFVYLITEAVKEYSPFQITSNTARLIALVISLLFCSIGTLIQQVSWESFFGYVLIASIPNYWASKFYYNRSKKD